MSLYNRQQPFRGTLFPAEAAVEAAPMPRVLRGADASRAVPVDEPVPMPRVLRGAARADVQPFQVAALDAAPAFRLPDVEETAKPQPEAAPAPPPAPVDVEALLTAEAEKWQQKMEEAAARARENGYRQGREDAERATAEQGELLRAHVAQEMEAMKAAWRIHMERGEALLADLSFEIAETILSAPLPDNVRRVSARALHEAVEALAGSPVTVSLHPVDRLRLQETGTEEEMRAVVPELRFDSDPALQEGEWVAASEVAAVRQVRAELLDALRRRLGLLALGKS